MLFKRGDASNHSIQDKTCQKQAACSHPEIQLQSGEGEMITMQGETERDKEAKKVIVI